jgi:DNA modification methylase
LAFQVQVFNQFQTREASMGSPDKYRYLSELAELDWDFTGQDPDSGFARFHWHPARFLPQLPAITIGALTNPGDRVLDPFCGSGTSLVEAVLQGRNVVGIDTNPIAVLISAAKIAPFEKSKFRRYQSELLRLIDQELGASGARFDIDSSDIPNVHEQMFWYHERTLVELGAIWHSIRARGGAYQVAADVSFSAILRGVSSQEKHWGWICDNVHPKTFTYKDPVGAFSAKLEEFERAATDLQKRTIGSPEAIVERGRCADVLVQYPPETFDLVMTSPPYFGVTDYSKAQRLSYLWFDLPLEESRLIETGARSKRHRRTALPQYLQEIKESFGEIARVLRPGAYCVIVLGESPTRDAHLTEFESIVEGCGIRIVERISRRLPSQRGLIATLQNERLVLCRRD